VSIALNSLCIGGGGRGGRVVAWGKENDEASSTTKERKGPEDERELRLWGLGRKEGSFNRRGDAVGVNQIARTARFSGSEEEKSRKEPPLHRGKENLSSAPQRLKRKPGAQDQGGGP